MGSPTHYACCGKEMLGRVHEKMVTQESTPGGDMFFASSSTVVGNGALICNDPCVPGEDFSAAVGNNF
jgi:hypothetical protein